MHQSFYDHLVNYLIIVYFRQNYLYLRKMCLLNKSVDKSRDILFTYSTRYFPCQIFIYCFLLLVSEPLIFTPFKQNH
jgi:hypothetical protein